MLNPMDDDDIGMQMLRYALLQGVIALISPLPPPPLCWFGSPSQLQMRIQSEQKRQSKS